MTLVQAGRRLLWAGDDNVPLSKMLLAGAAVWVVHAIVQLWINGVVLDETVVPAQIIAGAVRYPDGHPHQVYYSQAYSLQHYLAALIWAVAPGPLLSAVRDVLFVFLSAFTPFALALCLTRRPFWGHIAAALTVTEATLRFGGVYPTWVYPDYYSNGHIALHVAVLVVPLMLARLWRTAGLLLGLLPAIHAAMAVLVWPWSVAFLLLSSGRPQARDRSQLAASLAVGLGISAALALLILAFAPSPVPAPPFDTRIDAGPIYSNFLATTDPHRAPFPFWSFGYFINVVAFAGLSVLLLSSRDNTSQPDTEQSASRRALVWTLALAALAWSYVYGARLLHEAGLLPTFVYMTMPFRYSNASALLLAPLTAAAIAQAHRQLDERDRPAAMTVVAVTLLVAGMCLALEGGRFRFLYPGRIADNLIFVLWGLAFALHLLANRRRLAQLTTDLLAAAALGGALLVMNLSAGSQVWGAFSLSLIFSLAIVPILRVLTGQLGSFRWAAAAELGLAAACVLLMAAPLPGRRTERNNPAVERWSTITTYDRQLADWLAAHAGQDELILPALLPRTELQAKTGHPVLMELETLMLMTYMRSLAPSIGMLVRDVFGIDYSDANQLRQIAADGRMRLDAPEWSQAWSRRSRADWLALAEKYRFRLVLSRSDVPLDLTVALPGRDWTLYTIP
jgi:hypothetical protein